MVIWALFIILLEAEKYYVMPQGVYETEIKCLEAQTLFMLTAPKPKMNYESICVPTDQVRMQ